MGISVISFNCNSIRKNDEIICKLFDNCDILLLQETLITEEGINSISNFNLEYMSCHIPSFDPAVEGRNGRPRGGLSVFWNKKLDKFVTPIIYCKNVMGLKINFDNEVILLLNVYMPCDDRTASSLLEYKHISAQLHVIVENETIDKVLIAGDFNADPYKGRFWEELLSFKDDLNLTIADQLLPIESYTYLSPAHGSTSWLDHLLVSDMDYVDNIKIMYGETIFDHIPFKFNIKCNSFNSYTIENDDSQNTEINVNDFILWEKLAEVQNSKEYFLEY